MPSQVSKLRNRNRQARPKNQKSGPLVKVPAAQTRILRPSKPASVSTRDRVTTVMHSEYVAPITMRTEPTPLFSYPTNPGLAQSFPWLSGMANLYEKYKFRSLVYEYVPVCPTTSYGEVILSFDHDANDEGPNTAYEALSYADSCGAAPWCPMKLKVNLDTDKMLYTRPGPIIAVTDLKTVDIGAFYVLIEGAATSAGVAGNTLGRLMVHYTVDFYVPQLATPVFSGGMESGGTMTSTRPMGTAPTVHTGSLLPVKYSIPDGIFTFERDFEGIITQTLTGTGITGLGNLVTPTMEFTQLARGGAGSTDTSLVYAVKALAGQIFGFAASANTTLTKYDIDFATGNYAALSQ